MDDEAERFTMLPAEEIRTLERLSSRALPAQINRFYDGWLMRFNDGYTQRANAVYPIYAQPDDVLATILHCEAEYNSVHQPTRFKLTEATLPSHLDNILDSRGYETSTRHHVHAIKLRDFNGSKMPIQQASYASEAWIALYLAWMKTPEDLIKAVRHTLTKVPDHADFCTLLDEDGQAVALGYGVQTEAWYGLFGIVVDADKRHRGYGQAMTEALMSLGKASGATYAYLQVDGNNTSALGLYEKLGFRQQYDYWYRLRR